jgi:hypothetical protein
MKAVFSARSERCPRDATIRSVLFAVFEEVGISRTFVNEK